MKRFIILVFLLAFSASPVMAQPCAIGVTLAQMQAATKSQVVTVITNWLNNKTKDQIINFVLSNCAINVDTAILISDPETSTGDVRGPLTRSQVVRDINGNKVSTRTATWTYYSQGPVDTITIIQLNASDVEVGRTVIKHYLDGRQPTKTVTGIGG